LLFFIPIKPNPNSFLPKIVILLIIKIQHIEDMEENNNQKQAPLKNIQPGIFVLIVLVTVLISYQIFGSLFAYLTLGEQFFDLKNLSSTRIVISASQFLFLLFPVLILNTLRGDDFKTGFYINKPDYAVLAISIVAIIAIQPLLQFILIVQNKIIFSLPFDKTVIDMIKEFSDYLDEAVTKIAVSHSFSELFTVIFVIAVTPAICEELMFRGLILRNISASLKPVSAIILTGIIFAVFHFHPFNLIPLVILGIFITFVSYYGKSVISAVIIHFINNTISVFSVYLFGKETPDWQNISNQEMIQYAYLSAISLIILILSIYFIVRIYNSKKRNEQSF